MAKLVIHKYVQIKTAKEPARLYCLVYYDAKDTHIQTYGEKNNIVLSQKSGKYAPAERIQGDSHLIPTKIFLDSGVRFILQEYFGGQMMYKQLCIVMMVLINAGTAYASNTDVENIITYGNNLVYSGVACYTQEYHNFDTSTGASVPLENVVEESGANGIVNGTRTINIYFYDTKVRVENEYALNGDNCNMKDITTYNNDFSNILKIYNLPQNKNEKINADATIFEENKTAAIFDLRHYTSQIYGSPLENFIAGNHDTFDLAYTRYVSTEAVNDIDCVLYTAMTTDSVYTISAWLAPEYYYRPIKVVLAGDSMREETVIDYIEDEDTGYMLPRNINVTSYDKVNGKDVIRSTQAFDINSYKPNVELADETFIIDYPEGMRVYDYRIGKWVEVVKDTENNISYDYSIEELVE